MKQIFCAFLLFIASFGAGYAQQTTFSKVFSNFSLNPENGVIIKQITDGFLLLSGFNCLDNSDKSCCLISRLNNDGEIIWFKQYPFHPGSSSVEIFDNKIYISGHTEDNDCQFVLYCLNLNGDVIWDKKYGNTTKKEQFPRLSLWNDRWLLCGTQDRNINNRPAPYLYFVVTDMEGNQISSFNYGDENESTIPVKITNDALSNALISYRYCPDACFLDLKGGIVKIDTAGNLSSLLDLPYSFEPKSPMVDQIDNNTLAVKWHIDSELLGYDLTPPAIFFTDLSGTIQDTFVFQNQSLKEVRNMEAIWEKGLVGCGSNYIEYPGMNSSPLAGWVFRMDENRQIVWDRTYLDTTFQGRSFGLNQIIPTNDGGYIATGTITNWMTGVWESNNWILKLDSLGCLQPGCFDKNYITDTEEIIFLQGKEIQVYPNPVNTYLNVLLPENLTYDSGVKICLVSTLGVVVLEQLSTGFYTVVDLASTPSGSYYLIVWQGNEIINSKKILVAH